MFDKVVIDMLLQGILESLFMVVFSTLFAYLIGLPLGIVLVVTDNEGIRPCGWLNSVLNVIVNLTRSVPFLILAVAIIPFTRFVVGTSIGPKATVVSLVIAGAPFVARLVEGSIQEVDKGVIEAAQSMGATSMQIILRVMLSESMPSLINGCAIAATTILGYSAMAGFCGGGGLGAIAVNYGYYRYQSDIMLVTVILLIIIVQIIQETGMKLTRMKDKRK
ncbi:methionine ABC transporter permease [Youxingia wuxianensis]|uniref:ABC transporter permease n=1 Tax=Youxingia wuxianensis TaxID=2763678 RepID=A0A926IJ82_9FIRM|nr:methionine ABC transporter permease [Youxingia wuxianensis]MBC8586423.1 ABC transporter permease [Youxingia wuxianensis]